VSGEVEDGEEHAERFLDPEQADEGPFAVILYYRGRVEGRCNQAVESGDSLAGIITFPRTGPEEESEMEGWNPSVLAAFGVSDRPTYWSWRLGIAIDVFTELGASVLVEFFLGETV
jgi:hypothetical protein